jgi:hypothetical protein
MDRHQPTLGEFKPDDLQQVSGQIRADRQHSRRVAIGLEIDNDDRLVNRVPDRVDIDAMLERRSVKLHTL